MNFIFFTFRDFKKEGGGTIRMYGVLNALATQDVNIVFISNAQDYTKFHPSINHVFLNSAFSHKALFQALLAVLPASWVGLLFNKSLSKVCQTILKYLKKESKLFFFEYVDNSVGYLLKKTYKIQGYNNDIHGVATLEFDYQRKNSSGFLNKSLYLLKFYLADRLDRKVMENAEGIIYSSAAMKEFFDQKYELKKVKTYILPNLLADEASNNGLDLELFERVRKKYSIRDQETVLFFAGGYKNTAGVDDLVMVFKRLTENYKHLKLILIGEGPSKNDVVSYVNNNDLQRHVIFIDQVSYHDLFTYQSLADILICPDKMNEFSNMILHLKYLDSLVSNKIVLNGAFSSVMEINPNEEISLNFIPSNSESLYKKLNYGIKNKESLSLKYCHNKMYVLNHLTYRSRIKTLLN